MAVAKVKQNDICKDLLMKRKKMGELDAEHLLSLEDTQEIKKLSCL